MSVLLLAGVELVFLPVASMGLCFGFVLKTGPDNTEMFLLLLSRAYTEPRPFLLFILPCCQGCTGCWEETQAGQMIPTDQRTILYHMASCSVYKSEGKQGEGEGCSECWCLPSQVTVRCDRSCSSGDS